ncbi:hypothetical protein KQX54_001639 [Cotesia glomerata]|uniref:Uncharacterized protein n=1 Tax=Cotesia glomerata TaxID=32391 RepID=A0AAV7I038_COTGL|nr:hypothetical protein KQX54_001639 [Cotesia glomerata]
MVILGKEVKRLNGPKTKDQRPRKGKGTESLSLKNPTLNRHQEANISNNRIRKDSRRRRRRRRRRKGEGKRTIGELMQESKRGLLWWGRITNNQQLKHVESKVLVYLSWSLVVSQ